MISIILPCILLFISAAQCKPLKGYTPDVANISQDCAKQTQMDTQVLENVIKTGQVPEASENYFNFLECLYKKQNYFDDKGFVSYSAIESFLSAFYESKQLRKAIEPCEKIQVGSSLGERAYNGGKCVIEQLYIIEAEADGENADSPEETNTV